MGYRPEIQAACGEGNLRRCVEALCLQMHRNGPEGDETPVGPLIDDLYSVVNERGLRAGMGLKLLAVGPRTLGSLLLGNGETRTLAGTLRYVANEFFGGDGKALYNMRQRALASRQAFVTKQTIGRAGVFLANFPGACPPPLPVDVPAEEPAVIPVPVYQPVPAAEPMRAPIPAPAASRQPEAVRQSSWGLLLLGVAAVAALAVLTPGLPDELLVASALLMR